MTVSHATASGSDRTDPFRWDSLDIAAILADFAAADAPSQRQYARDHGIPRSTLGSWLRQDDPPDVDPHVAAFFRSCAGLTLLRRIVLSLFVAFHFRSTCGVRSLGYFLHLTQLDRFVASSYGALHSLAESLEGLIIAVTAEDQSSLATDMPARSIAACLDENFHRDHPYLVAIEPASNFLLLETHSLRRDGQTWTEELNHAMAGLNAKIVMICSDKAKGLLACAEHGLAVPHSPDLMHLQREIQKPMLLPLRRQIDRAEEEVEQLQKSVLSWQQKKQAYEAQPARPGRRPAFDEKIHAAEQLTQQAQGKQQVCEERLLQASEAIRELADRAHPFDAKTGKPLNAKEVGEMVDESLLRLVKVVEEAQLGEKAEAGLRKGCEWVTTLMTLVAWFWSLVKQRVEAMNLAEDAERAVYEELLPALYWEAHARRGRDAEQKGQRRELAEQLKKAAWREGGPLGRLPEERKAEVLRQANELAGLFVRSSSCVEGRNGRLALLQHGHVRLSKQRLKAQTALHNYLVRREDGTTAAERFFGKKHGDLFAKLLERMPSLPKPAAKRPRKAAKKTANAA